MEPTLTVLAYATAATLTAPLGVLPLRRGGSVPTRWMGWANALAAGLMLGAAYVLASAASSGVVAGTAGALLGIALAHLGHVAAGTQELDLNRLDARDDLYPYKVVLVATLHSAFEGVAIGVAMALDLSLGAFTAVAIAVHNVPEATLLGAVVRAGGAGAGRAAMAALAAAAPQIPLAVATFAVVEASPAALPWLLGVAAGALVHLVMVELLPESYREAGHTSIALVVSVATGLVVLLSGLGS